MPKPKAERMQGTPPPRFVEDCIGVKVRIPNSDRQTVGGQPVVLVDTSPMLWMPDTEWTGRWLKATDKSQR